VRISSNATSIYDNLLSSLNFGSVKTAIFYLPGLPIGTLIVFILRQLRYKSKKKDTNNFPGGTILLLFMIAVPIVLSFDALMIIQGRAPLWYSNTVSSNDQFVSVYGLKQFIEFSQSYLINPVYYVATVSAWIFDWYLFSKIWIS
jgi:hypothetical protein